MNNLRLSMTKNISNDLLKQFDIDLSQFMKNKTNIICELKRKLLLNCIHY